MIKTDRMTRARDGYKFGLTTTHADAFLKGVPREGTFIFEMTDARTGERLHYFEKKNIITLDAGILAAILFSDPDARTHGIYMLAVGTGATGSVLSPNAPDARQRKLNAEIARKAFSSWTFRDAGGNAVSIPTNVVDFTTVFGEAEAVGPLTEMGLLSPISSNPLSKADNPDIFPNRTLTLDLGLYDILVNYLTYGAIVKPSTAVLSITWRLTF